jgi:hypothetical protein
MNTARGIDQLNMIVMVEMNQKGRITASPSWS